MNSNDFTDRPQAWNAKQMQILKGLAAGGSGTFDRWRAMRINGKACTSGGSTTPYTLFIRGLIVSDGEFVSITDKGRLFLEEIEAA